MLALSSTSRRHLPSQHHHTTTTFPPSPQQDALHSFNHSQKLALNQYLESQQQQFASFPDSSLEPFMGSYDFANPAIRVQHSTPTPQQQQGAFSQTPMLSTTNNAGLEAWNSYQNSLQTPARGHQRASSASSTTSSTSPYAIANNYNQTFLNNLPTPTHTPTQDSFLTASNLNNFTPTSSAMDQNIVAHMSMKQALMDQGDDAQDLPDFAHSARQSVSSYGHDSPATPRTQIGDDLNETRSHPTVPKFDRTYTDIAADNFYDPRSTAPSVPQTKPTQSSLLSPYRGNTDGVQQAIQAANLARSQSQQTQSQSPSSTASRDNSPFRRESPYMKAQLRWGGEKERPQTISPKEAFLPYQESEDSKASLFPDSGANDFDAQYSSNGGEQYRNATQTGFNTASVQPLRRDGWATSAMQAVPSLPQTASFNFATPSVQPSMHSMGMGATSQYRPTSNVAATIEQTPEFPAHLTSMESSASEAEPPSGSQSSDVFLHKPASSRADTGTYSCTYHGCVQRFETPQKLQKHKRDDHRNINTAMTSAALLERNSQAGPHKCERINPTTGKPCNTIFSRPYDLTRHEDTIHNARKQKVRCALCVEEKTFSRNDALTRHMRVVHPEIEFPGKHRKRGDHQD